MASLSLSARRRDGNRRRIRTGRLREVAQGATKREGCLPADEREDKACAEHRQDDADATLGEDVAASVRLRGGARSSAGGDDASGSRNRRHVRVSARVNGAEFRRHRRGGTAESARGRAGADISDASAYITTASAEPNFVCDAM